MWRNGIKAKNIINAISNNKQNILEENVLFIPVSVQQA